MAPIVSDMLLVFAVVSGVTEVRSHTEAWHKVQCKYLLIFILLVEKPSEIWKGSYEWADFQVVNALCVCKRQTHTDTGVLHVWACTQTTLVTQSN